MCSPRRIVVAEDEDADALLLKRALDKAQIAEPVQFARDGKETIRLLRDPSEQVLLLLDLRMPNMDGFEVLQWLKQRPDTAHVSVVVLSSSGETEDIKRAGELGVVAYIVKPNDQFEMVRIIERVMRMWPDTLEARPEIKLLKAA